MKPYRLQDGIPKRTRIAVRLVLTDQSEFSSGDSTRQPPTTDDLVHEMARRKGPSLVVAGRFRVTGR